MCNLLSGSIKRLSGAGETLGHSLPLTWRATGVPRTVLRAIFIVYTTYSLLF